MTKLTEQQTGPCLSPSFPEKFNWNKFMGQAMQKCVMSYANNKGADQLAHPRSLISTFVVRCLDSTICILAVAKVSRF